MSGALHDVDQESIVHELSIVQEQAEFVRIKGDMTPAWTKGMLRAETCRLHIVNRRLVCR